MFDDNERKRSEDVYPDEDDGMGSLDVRRCAEVCCGIAAALPDRALFVHGVSGDHVCRVQ